jgi:Zn-dependent M28 family amino/carboxypeptidase
MITKFMTIVLLCCVFLMNNAAIAQNYDAAQTAKNLRKHIKFLASDDLQGRAPNTTGATLAAQYLVAQFAQLGLLPAGDGNSYLQNFEFALKKSPHDTAIIQKNLTDTTKQRGKAQNILAYINNGAPHTIVVGAHYDHLGYGKENSLFTPKKPSKPQIHNGADDNASGTAALIEIARNIKKNAEKYNHYNYLFIAFSGEEMGLYGSKYFVNNPTIDLNTVNYMLNMDMIGRLNKTNTVIINGVGTSPVWAQMIDSTGWQGKLKFKTTQSGIGPSDHTSFYLKDLPVLHFFTGNHPQYHRPTDDAKLINYAGEATIIAFMLDMMQKTNDLPKIAFTKTKEEAQRDTPSFKVTMGIIPDYTYEGTGVKIDGVSEGRPAQKAGIKANDVIIKIGSEPIPDMMGYMTALSKQTKGISTTVTVQRGNNTLVLPLIF